MSDDEYIVCETHAAITSHLRRAADGPIKLGGHSSGDGIATLCGKPLGGWDTMIPAEEARCMICRQVAGLPRPSD